MKPLTERQTAIYEFIREKIQSRGYGPTIREIGDAFQIHSLNGVICHLKALEKKGWITRGKKMSRAIQLLGEPPMVDTNQHKVAVAIIESTYEAYKDWKSHDKEYLAYELNNYNDNIPVWRDMDDNTKCAAIEYVYNKRDTIELHSDIVESWVQATAYFMLYYFCSDITNGEEPDLEMFFDDLDFMLDEEILNDSDVQKIMGISSDFTKKF
jgi:SOS-response transcriptional repressor LexA